ncbi:hypothetical protein [Paenibacillus sp. OK003]|uniref:hypothetical protein n=1 Tax=Paenibacillus sp. OK003 TaxID=1884380 RepID=UPI0008CE72C1|nr:hypothetical protein [Paenibacillus sp. OK003]SEL81174.1 hypothetical protein SAMN05518856_11922 [Paenibacillus sp. OK003]
MHMDFRVYQVIFSGDLIGNGELLFEYLKGLSKIPGEFGFEYCITSEIDYQSNIICGCLSEEYSPDINSVDDEKNVYVPDVAPYLNTYFALDLQEQRLLVQHREYPATNLNWEQSMARLAFMIRGGFEQFYGVDFDYVITNRDVSDDEFIDVFNENRITSLRVKIFDQGRMLSRDAEIFNDSALNDAWIQGWNSDESETYEIVLKAPGRGGTGDLRESPIAISLINLPVKEILELNYWTEDDGAGTMSRTDLKKLRVQGLDRRTQPITGVDRLLSDLRNRRLEIRNFIAFRL